MQGRGVFAFLGLRSFEGTKEKTKGQVFYSLDILQGTETFSVFLEKGQELFFQECQRYDAIDMDFSVFLKNDRGITVIGLRILNLYNIVSAATGEIIDFTPKPISVPATPGTVSESKSDNKSAVKAS